MTEQEIKAKINYRETVTCIDCKHYREAETATGNYRLCEKYGFIVCEFGVCDGIEIEGGE
jgi:hypothetical protein